MDLAGKLSVHIYMIVYRCNWFHFQDGTFSVSDFIEIFHKHDVQRVLYAYPDTISINIHCSDSGLWNALPDKSFAKICKIKVNPVDVLNSGDERINNFIGMSLSIIVSANVLYIPHSQNSYHLLLPLQTSAIYWKLQMWLEILDSVTQHCMYFPVVREMRLCLV